MRKGQINTRMLATTITLDSEQKQEENDSQTGNRILSFNEAALYISALLKELD
jgi:hypothetical protein